MEGRSHLLALDADLAAAIADATQQRAAVRSITATVLTLAAGETLDVRAIAEAAPVGTLLLDGFLVREMLSSGRVSADLLGPEDLMRPADISAHVSPLPCTVEWTAATAVRLALLDHELMERSRPWPQIAATLIERAGRPGRRLASAHGIATLPSVDMRLLASLWEWASRWGYVASAGVRLDLPLSHARIGHLIGAQRPTVTAALGRLRRRGLLQQIEGGGWILSAPSGERAEALDPGVQMPLIAELRVPPRRRLRGLAGPARAPQTTATSPAQTGADLVHPLLRRLAEQRRTLSIASERHEQMLARLARESTQLRANSAALGRLARQRPSERPALELSAQAPEAAPSSDAES